MLVVQLCFQPIKSTNNMSCVLVMLVSIAGALAVLATLFGIASVTVIILAAVLVILCCQRRKIKYTYLVNSDL